ncbi:hypothetical protein HHK36_020936 [Tetracentron sinense]|uniref:Uncharacterized protein n=1 Tax=Tetracentron sinense TaxID=13715 RepID=A0A834YSG0_TETSI|nr:hypothetical protein HHK36_020936 [Tetracentron sinense]
MTSSARSWCTRGRGFVGPSWAEVDCERQEAREPQEFVYRISTAKEWEVLQSSGSSSGGNLDKTSGFFHLSKLDQVFFSSLFNFSTLSSDLIPTAPDFLFAKNDCSIRVVHSTLQNFFLKIEGDLYLLQIDAKKLGDGLVYGAADGSNFFPHFYGPNRSFSPLPLEAVTKAEKLVLKSGQFSCSLLN